MSRKAESTDGLTGVIELGRDTEVLLITTLGALLGMRVGTCVSKPYQNGSPTKVSTRGMFVRAQSLGFVDIEHGDMLHDNPPRSVALLAPAARLSKVIAGQQ